MRSRAIICGVVLLALASVAQAAPDAGAKARGEFNFYGHSVHSSLQSAHSHARHYATYLTHVQSLPAPATVDVEVAKSAGDAIGDSISTMRRHLAVMRKHATALGDKEALGMIDDVERNLAEAGEHHAALQATHAGQSIDAATAKQHVDKVNTALEKARREHDEVMKKIGEGT
ncbi:MAG: hypothetical protein ACKO1M_01375 [Planctomycetota bacterium]